LGGKAAPPHAVPTETTEKTTELLYRDGQADGSRFQRLRNPVYPAHRPDRGPGARSLRRVQRRERLTCGSLVVADVAATVVALVAFALAAPATKLTVGALVTPPIAVALAHVLGLYERDTMVLRKTTLEESPRLAVLAALLALVVWLGESVILSGPISKPAILLLWGAFLVGGVLLRRLARRLMLRRVPHERCLVVGPRGDAERLAWALSSQGANASVVAQVEAGGLGRNGVSSGTALSTLVAEVRPDRVVVSSHGASPSQLLEILHTAKGLGVRVSVLPTLLGAIGPAAVFDDVYGVPLYAIPSLGLRRDQRAVKRAFDLIGGGLLLLVLAPLLVGIALAIRLDSGGGVFFRQIRIGRDGDPFRIFKFRTMVTDAEERKGELRRFNQAKGGLFKMADDPRVTRVGRLLRRTSLDELPQLFNVIRGEMSLVGPRPLVVDEDAHVQGWDRRRLLLTPGMTGHWQILGSSRVPMHEMVKIDYRYVASWSLWGDIKLLLRTVPYVLARRGM
jgi:exopolysaccharide biosynthesis polyprenyl glycosylphosphotransferase